jgi:hypothetical protein
MNGIERSGVESDGGVNSISSVQNRDTPAKQVFRKANQDRIQ